MMDERRFHDVYRQTAGPLRSYVARTMGSVSHADDIVQETYLRLLRQPPAIEDPGEMRAWLFRVASHLVVDHWRRRKHEIQEDPASARAATDPDGALRIDMTRTFQRLRP